MDTHKLRNKNLYDLNEQELRIRCAYDEQYIRQLEKEISRLKTIVERKEKKFEDRFWWIDTRTIRKGK